LCTVRRRVIKLRPCIAAINIAENKDIQTHVLNSPDCGV